MEPAVLGLVVDFSVLVAAGRSRVTTCQKAQSGSECGIMW
jgi:hypothetical protein